MRRTPPPGRPRHHQRHPPLNHRPSRPRPPAVSTASGPSPRARGAVRASTTSRATRGVHPRVRGERNTDEIWLPQSTGPSPRARGAVLLSWGFSAGRGRFEQLLGNRTFSPSGRARRARAWAGSGVNTGVRRRSWGAGARGGWYFAPSGPGLRRGSVAVGATHSRTGGRWSGVAEEGVACVADGLPVTRSGARMAAPHERRDVVRARVEGARAIDRGDASHAVGSPVRARLARSSQAHLFQQRVSKSADIRLTAVGDDLTAVRIDGSPGVDRRRHDDRLTYTPYPSPPPRRRGAPTLMLRTHLRRLLLRPGRP